jgi:hypothetical protein
MPTNPTGQPDPRAILQAIQSCRGGAAEEHSSLGHEDPIWVDFARGMAPKIAPSAQAKAQLMKPAPAARPSAKVLNIAAGHGIFGITVAQHGRLAGFESERLLPLDPIPQSLIVARKPA